MSSNMIQHTSTASLIAKSETFANVMRARDEAYNKAIDSLSRYKFEMFGYWASGWVKYNQLLPKEYKQSNPFRDFINLAKDKTGAN